MCLSLLLLASQIAQKLCPSQKPAHNCCILPPELAFACQCLAEHLVSSGQACHCIRCVWLTLCCLQTQSTQHDLQKADRVMHTVQEICALNITKTLNASGDSRSTIVCTRVHFMLAKY